MRENTESIPSFEAIFPGPFLFKWCVTFKVPCVIAKGDVVTGRRRVALFHRLPLGHRGTGRVGAVPTLPLHRVTLHKAPPSLGLDLR